MGGYFWWKNTFALVILDTERLESVVCLYGAVILALINSLAVNPVFRKPATKSSLFVPLAFNSM